jgi:C4-dicarboxylate-specific signal transduction histidine kinase
MSNQFNTSRELAELKKMYFSDEHKRLRISKSETLLTGDVSNDRLYLVLSGRLTCYLKDEEGKDYEVMQSSRNMFLGVYSFFSYEQRSYLTVVALEDTELAYIERNEPVVTTERFAQDFLPVIVHEIYLRQVLTQQMNRDRQAAIKKLYESEKMILLGQLAAGLAHELNNAVGIVERNTEWLINELNIFLKKKELQALFQSSLQGGQQLSTIEIRERRDWLESKYNLSSKVAKQLAKTNLDKDALKKLVKEGLSNFDRIHQLTETAIVLHDMRVAANHATHVVRSVRDLGTTQKRMPVETSIYETIRQALVLTKNLVQNVTVKIDKSVEGKIMVNPGDLVQVWVNLIKNACESMDQANQPQPVLAINLVEDQSFFIIKISDNGTGIPEGVIQRIFQPSFTTKVSGLSFGLGLGLPTVKKIIESYGGLIDVTSNPGEATFIIQLPKVQSYGSDQHYTG